MLFEYERRRYGDDSGLFSFFSFNVSEVSIHFGIFGFNFWVFWMR